MKTKLYILAIGLTLTATTYADGANWGKVKDGLFTYVLNPMLQTNNPELMRGKVLSPSANAAPKIHSEMSAGQVKYALKYYEDLFDQKVAEFVQANRDDLENFQKIKILCGAESAAVSAMNVAMKNYQRTEIPNSLRTTLKEKSRYYSDQSREMVYEQNRVHGSNVNCFEYFPYK